MFDLKRGTREKDGILTIVEGERTLKSFDVLSLSCFNVLPFDFFLSASLDGFFFLNDGKREREGGIEREFDHF